jgi:hypothetical protein
MKLDTFSPSFPTQAKLVPLFDFKFLYELAAPAVGT